MANYRIIATYYACTYSDVEFPEGRTWEDVEEEDE